MGNPKEILKKYWGYSDFRPLQLEIIESVLQKNDTLALLPTGGGKSVCFQVPAMLLDGICLVVSPLIALMKDQIKQLEDKNIPSACIYSGTPFNEIDQILDSAVNNQIKFLYVSPERLKTELFKERLKKMKVCLIAIDEAHCISKWGYDFRPAYLQISLIKILVPYVTIIALTATANEIIRKDILEKLELKKPKIFVQSFARQNLAYTVIESDNKEHKLLQIIDKVQGSFVVYTKTRKRTNEIAKFLLKNGISADFYHAGLTIKDRNAKQENWINNKTRIIVATNAFGMGIDKADVRCVVHLDICENLEAYYQESGRAGRDNLKSHAISIYNDVDIENLERNLKLKYPEIEIVKKVYQSLCNYYKLAFGSEVFNSHDFDIQHFCSTFGLNPLTTHYALKILENQAIIYLNDVYFNPAKLIIRVNSKSLSEFQDRNPKYGQIIKTILRIYGGQAFSNYINISETEIANVELISQNDATDILKNLQKLEIIDYLPQTEKPQIGFLTQIQDSEKLNINHKELENRKLIEKRALAAVKNYTLQKAKCRMQFIQDYFDEATEQKCGICDICINQKRKDVFEAGTEELYQRIKILLPCHISKIENEPSFLNKNEIAKIVQHKLDVNELGIDEFGLVYPK